MSATGRTANLRLPDDEYYTPAWAVHRLLECQQFVVPRHGFWLEPTAGEGAIIQAVRQKAPRGPAWTAIELRKECEPALRLLKLNRVIIGDFRGTCASTKGAPHSVAISNPPFSIAQEVVEHCMKLAHHTVMLLRINFLGSAEREGFFKRVGVPDVYVLPNRPSFWVNKNEKVAVDATEYAWFHWPRAMRGMRAEGRLVRLALTPKEDLAASRAEIAMRYEAWKRKRAAG